MKHLRIFGAIGTLTLCLFCFRFIIDRTSHSFNVVQIDVVTDVCPNLPGIQPTVPDGMIVDKNGNCVTPTPTPQPPEQPSENIPPTTPSQPSDVCPEDYVLNPETGDCLPTDSLEIPDVGDDDDYAYGGTEADDYDDDDRRHLHNVPEFLQDIAQFFAGLVPESVQEFFRNLPDEVVDATPSFTLLWSLLLIIFPVFQVVREHLYKRRLMALYQHEKNIAEEKDNFITLASHYLRTPMATMRDSATMLLGDEQITHVQAETIGQSLKLLGVQVSVGIEGVSKNPELQNLADSPSDKPKPAWRSAWFWIPIAISIFMTILLNFFIGVVGEKEIGTSNLFLQLVVIAIFIIALYLIIRNYYIEKVLRQEKKQLIAREQAIDSARNEFIREQTSNIGEALNELYLPKPTSTTLPPVVYMVYNSGLTALGGVYGKFLLLTQIQTSETNKNASTFSIKSKIDRAISVRMEKIKTKNITIENNISDADITQNISLFTFVVGTLIDNAVKFSNQNGKVVISGSADSKDKTVRLKFSDNGQGIDPDKLNQLFKPFSRAESAVQFSYEGLGLSLFLCRLIVNYMGGTISATSELGQGTEIAVTVPVGDNQ